MCGRMGMHKAPSWRALYGYYNIINSDDDPLKGLYENFDIAPTAKVPIVANRQGERRMTVARWGMVPRWAREMPNQHLFNARSDTLETQYRRWLSIPATLQDTVSGAWWLPFKDGFRCLMPMSGYYEWKDGQAYWFRIADRETFTIAGLWDYNPHLSTRDWPKGIVSCAMITVEPNEQVAPIHDRMPAILHEDDYEAWLSIDTSYEDALALLRPYSGTDMIIEPVVKAGDLRIVGDDQHELAI